MRDSGGELTTRVAIDPQSDLGGSVVNGNIIDTRGYKSGVFSFLVGATAGAPTSATLDVTIEQGADAALGDATAITALAKQAVDPASGAVVQVDVNFKDTLRYLRLSGEVTFVGGTTPTLTYAAGVTLGEAASLPVA